MRRIIWEAHAACRFFDDTSIDERLNITMHGFHIPPNLPRGFADRHDAFAGHGLQQFPALAREGLPKQFG